MDLSNLQINIQSQRKLRTNHHVQGAHVLRGFSFFPLQEPFEKPYAIALVSSHPPHAYSADPSQHRRGNRCGDDDVLCPLGHHSSSSSLRQLNSSSSWHSGQRTVVHASLSGVLTKRGSSMKPVPSQVVQIICTHPR